MESCDAVDGDAGEDSEAGEVDSAGDGVAVAVVAPNG